MGLPPADLPWTRVVPSPGDTHAQSPLQDDSSADSEPLRRELTATHTAPAAGAGPGTGCQVHTRLCGRVPGCKGEVSP